MTSLRSSSRTKIAGNPDNVTPGAARAGFLCAEGALFCHRPAWVGSSSIGGRRAVEGLGRELFAFGGVRASSPGAGAGGIKVGVEKSRGRSARVWAADAADGERDGERSTLIAISKRHGVAAWQKNPERDCCLSDDKMVRDGRRE